MTPGTFRFLFDSNESNNCGALLQEIHPTILSVNPGSLKKWSKLFPFPTKALGLISHTTEHTV